MTPRWTRGWATREHLHFIGGCGRFDLWLHTFGSITSRIRVTWGSRTEQWTVYAVDDGVLRHKPTRPEHGVPTREEARMVLTYLKTFCPEIAPYIRDQDTLCGAHNEEGGP